MSRPWRSWPTSRLVRIALARLLALAAVTPPVAGVIPAQAAQPNIVFVMADDLDVGSIGRMTALQRLAQEGTSFTRAFVSSPLCAPSRATFLTGRYPQNTGVRRNKPPFGGFESFYASGLERDTVATWLQRAGYRTGLIGKYFNQFPRTAPAGYIPPGWDYWVSPKGGNYLHSYFEYYMNDNGDVFFRGSNPEDYVIQLYSGKAQYFIRSSGNRPFALFLWLPSPHTPEIAAPKFTGLYPQAKVPRLPSFWEGDVSDKPPFLRFPAHGPDEIASFDASYRARLQMMRSVDDVLAALRATLAAQGVLDNTYIVFSADNGWHHGYHNLVPWKGTAFDQDIRVPLIVRGPDVPAGRTIRRLISNSDVAPTFAAWAGADAPSDIDGRSFAALLTAPDPAIVPWRKRLPFYRLTETVEGPAETWPSYAALPGQTQGYSCFSHIPAWTPVGTDLVNLPELRGVRSERYTFVEYATGDLELYDQDQDPHELRNAICRVGADFRADFRRLSAGLANCRGAACRELEDR